MNTHIHLHNFSFRHASRINPTLTDVNLTIRKGERVLVLGASGSGKSTLLAALAGVLGADEGDSVGTLEINGVVGMVMQDPDSQVIASKVGDDIAFGCENLNVPADEIWPRVHRALELVGLNSPIEHATEELSGGQKQRLALAAILAMGADIIVLDEPTANLDPASVQEVVQAVESVVSQTQATVIVVEHRVATWQSVVDRAVVLEHGRIVADDVLEKIVAEQGQALAQKGVWMPGWDPQFAPMYPTTSPPEPAICTEGLMTGWNRPMREHTLEIPLGFSTVITGPNGAGKTTLMLTLAGLLPAHGGTIKIHDHIAQGLKNPPIQWKSADLARRVGYVFQDPEHQFVARTVREELLVGPKVRKLADASDEDIARADEILQRLGLDHLALANPFSLSGGQKRRLSVATTLIHTPRLIFLDEPTFGQDRNTFIELVTLLRELTAKGSTVVSVSHDPLFVRAMADFEVQL
ncbi:ABC transporter ATP-binding protein [Corynebacterium sp. HS2168-gen11]|uniref:ABC transporter ATP-binding protein n=1 Tax=Corynebacterium sp. HS2168-gen11 TaxID=2974027 RepID=UPI00216AFF38|nr:ATP-binding cassette domain-containing protein [Corynebacterium sp. HS2168-gen11]MCS4534945.1 ATP-binding cassette domain-containing protein [Corynebacterium sp. HS2168-gen11]